MTDIIAYGLDGQRRPRYMTPERDAQIRASYFPGLDPAAIADEIGLPLIWTRTYLRALGLMKCRNKADAR